MSIQYYEQIKNNAKKSQMKKIEELTFDRIKQATIQSIYGKHLKGSNLFQELNIPIAG